MKRQSPNSGFTLIEMLVVMAVIAILTGLILAVNAVVQNTAARSKASTQIKAMSAACEAYKSDNGGYPQSSSNSGSTTTDSLDPSSTSAAIYNPINYTASCLFLWQQLSGHLNDTNPTVQPPAGPNLGTNYAGDIFTDAMLQGTKTGNRVTGVTCIQDPFGNSYGYGTAGLAAQQKYKSDLITNGSATLKAAGYNPTFDMWSTAGATTQTGTAGAGNDVKNKWVKNW